MSDTPIFSIIIPVYNVQNFLRQCIDSVLEQKTEDYEILLIDDGSTDASGKICDEYASKDKRIRTFHQQNGGLGVARNTGILNAKGTWILFLDSDDYWIPDTLEKIGKCIIENKQRCLFAFRYMEDHDGQICSPPQKGFESGLDVIVDFSQFLAKYEMTAGWAVWKLVIHRKLLYQEEALLFLDNVSHGEDLYWLIRLFQRAGEITYCNEDVYRYRIRQGSLSETDALNCFKWRESLNNTFDWFCLHEEFDSGDCIKEYIAMHYLPHIFDSASIKYKSEWKAHYDEMRKMLKYIPAESGGKRGKTLFALLNYPEEVCFWGCLALKKAGQYSQARVRKSMGGAV